MSTMPINVYNVLVKVFIQIYQKLKSVKLIVYFHTSVKFIVCLNIGQFKIVAYSINVSACLTLDNNL